MKCAICKCETAGTPGLNNPATIWPLCLTCKTREDAAAERQLSTLAAEFRRIDGCLNRQEMRRLRKLSDSELAVEVTAKRLLPRILGPDFDAMERHYTNDDRRRDDLDAADDRGGLEERAKVAREWEVRD